MACLRESALNSRVWLWSLTKLTSPIATEAAEPSRDYPRPSVAVDTALLTLLDGHSTEPTLGVLEVRRDNNRSWGLPGTFLHEGERLIDAVLRSLQDKAGVSGLRPRQLHVFDDPQRDDRGWVLSVAHVDVVCIDRLDSRRATDTRIVSAERPGRLPYGHSDIVRQAVADLRTRYAEAPDPDGLLPGAFTLRELRVVHEAVAGEPLQRDTFRRTMEHELLATGELVTRGPGGPPSCSTARASAPTRPDRPSEGSTRSSLHSAEHRTEDMFDFLVEIYGEPTDEAVTETDEFGRQLRSFAY